MAKRNPRLRGDVSKLDRACADRGAPVHYQVDGECH
jgi:hypothetical protein